MAKKKGICIKTGKQPAAGFIFSFLGGWGGIAIGFNYAFGKYKKETKTLGWVMALIGFFSMAIWKSI